MAYNSPCCTGSTLPSIKINLKGKDVDILEHFQDKTGVLFGLPGAFSPICTDKHLPGFRDKSKDFKSKVDFLGCMAVNDPYVLKAWAKHTHVYDQLTFVADVEATLTKALGLQHEYNDINLGLRCRRFAMVIVPGAKVYWIGFDEEAFADVAMRKVDEMRAKLPLAPSIVKELAPSSTTAASTKRVDDDTKWDYECQGADWEALGVLEVADSCVKVNTDGSSGIRKFQSPIDIDPSLIADDGLTASNGNPNGSLKLEGRKSKVLEIYFSSYDGFTHQVVTDRCTFQVRPRYNKGYESEWQSNWLRLQSQVYGHRTTYFHSPSEHTIAGDRAPLEMQMMFESAFGGAVGVSVLFTGGINADASNSYLEAILGTDNFGSEYVGETTSSPRCIAISVQHGGLRKFLTAIFPSYGKENENREVENQFYTYEGSHTIPPCSHPVSWFVSRTYATATCKQLETFQKVLKFGKSDGNYRCIQKHEGMTSTADCQFL